jgi:hypothetical protein
MGKHFRTAAAAIIDDVDCGLQKGLARKSKTNL